MPRLDAVTLGLSGPLRNPRRHGETRPGSPASPLRLPSRRFGPRPSTRPQLRPRSQASRPRAQQLAGFAPRHSPWSPEGSAPSWPLPPAQSLRSDPGRPGEGTISSTFSPAPPEREVQACAIFGSLATPLQSPRYS
ncbi:hypothetical protein NDU88_005727 [Pleurodeles waltl]|uniref:Uncharacterized protein n=1 Tax=Pleurodeles waltl TaxID=8319 RepID=A0AAV7L3G8_PLEWA|nr:hypothetical protein NDU88_005727 [Pleurodeles waltl]